MTRLHIFRHGETRWNASGLMQGHMDSPLSENGRKQAAGAASLIADESIERAYASSSGRAMETARILLSGRQTRILPEDDLREINLGLWEGMEKESVQRAHSSRYRDFWESPAVYESLGGESFQALWDRVTRSTRRIIDSHPGESVVIVSHAASVKAMMSWFVGRPLAEIWAPPIAENLSHSLVETDGREVNVIKFCGQPWEV